MSTCGLQFKRGASFSARCTYIPPAGGLPALVGAIITSEIRNNGKLVQRLACELAPDGMSFMLTADESETITWPVATVQWDIRVEVDEEVIYTETIALQVLYNITAPEVTP